MGENGQNKEPCPYLRKAGYGPSALYGTNSDKSPDLPMLKYKKSSSKNGHCPFCLSPLIRFKWNSVCDLLTCDNWNCHHFRRPAGIINLETSLEDNQTLPLVPPVEDICLNCPENECFYKIREGHLYQRDRKATNEEIRRVRHLYAKGINPFRINSMGMFPQLKRRTIQKICTQEGAYSKEWEDNRR